jgi:hypothetical protein
MAVNNFLPFGTAGGANVIDQVTYSGLAARSAGFSSGTAQSAQLNKVWRQSSIMAAVLAQLIVDRTGADAIDDGTTSTLLANLKSATAALNGDSTQVFNAANPVAGSTGNSQVLNRQYADGRYLQGSVVTPASDPTYADSSVNPPSTSWVRGAMSAIATAAGFVFSVNATGYIKLPSWLGGFIMQWGSTSSIAVNGSVTTALPLTFPNNHLISLGVLNTANAAWVGVSSKTLSSVTIANSNASSNPTSAFFLSIGN